VKICPQCGVQYDHDIKFCPADGSALRAPPGQSMIGAVIADRYHVVRKLGEGGMGEVYLAEHVKMGRLSALKLIAPALAREADAIGRFTREAANASKITHPNIAAIYDFGETPDGLVYLAMEYVEGESLTALLRRHGALPLRRTAEIARQIAGALDAAHERGVVHRDLKPDNIMISPGRDGVDVVKVVDFGIAKASTGDGAGGATVTKTGMVIGTPEYMSPEQLSGESVDGRSDTYSLGLVAFTMLSGALPFPRATLQEMLLMRLTERPRTLAEVRPEMSWPIELQRVLDRALDRDPAVRHARSGDLGADLVRVAGVNAVASPAPGTQPTAPSRSPLDAAPELAKTVPIAPPRARATTRPLPSAPDSRTGPRVLQTAALLVVVLAGALAWRRLSHRAPAPAPASLAAQSAPGVAALDSQPAKSVSPTPPPHAATDTAKASTASHTRAAHAPSRSGGGPKSHAPSTAHPAPAPAPATAERDTVARTMAPTVFATLDTATAPNRPGATATRAAGPPGEARAERGIEMGTALVAEGHSDAALLVLRNALKHVQTHDDSVTALYRVSEALIQKSHMRKEAGARDRACEILVLIRKDGNHKLASDIRDLYSQECM